MLPWLLRFVLSSGCGSLTATGAGAVGGGLAKATCCSCLGSLIVGQVCAHGNGAVFKCIGAAGPHYGSWVSAVANFPVDV